MPSAAELPHAPPNEEMVYRVVAQAGVSLGVAVQRSTLFSGSKPLESDDLLDGLVRGGQRSGIYFQEIEFQQLIDALNFLDEGFPIIVGNPDGSITLVDAGASKRFEAFHFDSHGVRRSSFTRRELRGVLLRADNRCFVAKKELECDALSTHSQNHSHGHEHAHEHLSPQRRFLSLLAMEQRDIYLLVLFAFVAGVLTLATPLAVESLVNVVSWGVYLQPLVILGLVLFISLGLAGVLRVLQNVVVELIQRRQFVRIVGDLAHRFPRANQSHLVGEYPRELANRIFDIMTIQKATAVLLLDGVSIVLTTFLGMVLLAFYHPFLLGFDIILLISMISITWVLGRGGVRTAIDESVTKYRTVHWLQDVLASPGAFKIGGGEGLAIDRANELAGAYIQARQKQFRVVIRQTAFAIFLQVFASTTVLALGGWLVIQGQLTLGQLVAAELVVTVVVGAFAKAGKSLEKFYDLMAGIDKVGHLIDIPVDPRPEMIEIPAGRVAVGWTDLVFQRPSSTSLVPSLQLDSGESVAIVGDDVDGKADFARALAGLMHPTEGVIQVDDLDPATIAGGTIHGLIGYAEKNEVFTATLRENVDLGRAGLGQSRVRQALDAVRLSEVVLRLSGGIQTHLQTGGFPLTEEQVARLMIARAIVSKPKLLVVNGVLDRIAPSALDPICRVLNSPNRPWTLIVVTDKQDIASRFGKQIALRRRVHKTRKGTE